VDARATEKKCGRANPTTVEFNQNQTTESITIGFQNKIRIDRSIHQQIGWFAFEINTTDFTHTASESLRPRNALCIPGWRFEAHFIHRRNAPI
jgi:hypothetical protein